MDPSIIPPSSSRFNPRPRVRGRSWVWIPDAGRGGFNPRPRVRGRCCHPSDETTTNVSIRAPACGGDKRSAFGNLIHLFQSAPPRAGAIWGGRGGAGVDGFNPRPRVRGRSVPFASIVHVPVSIRAPACGGDLGSSSGSIALGVSIRAPACGGDPLISAAALTRSFQSAPPRAGAISGRARRKARHRFNPRPRVRGRFQVFPDPMGREVSIRAPACGGDWSPRSPASRCRFQSAPPRAGAICCSAR